MRTRAWKAYVKSNGDVMVMVIVIMIILMVMMIVVINIDGG